MARTTVAAQEQERFIEIAETELLSLHEGDFVRYQAQPIEFAAWKANWRANR